MAVVGIYAWEGSNARMAEGPEADAQYGVPYGIQHLVRRIVLRCIHGMGRWHHPERQVHVRLWPAVLAPGCNIRSNVHN